MFIPLAEVESLHVTADLAAVGSFVKDALGYVAAHASGVALYHHYAAHTRRHNARRTTKGNHHGK